MTSKYADLRNVNSFGIESVLSGNVRQLLGAFTWKSTPEGHKYWSEIYHANKLPSRARFKLQAMLRAKEKHVTP